MKRLQKNYLIIYVVCVLMVLLLFGVILYAVFSKMDKSIVASTAKGTSETTIEAAELGNQFLILRNDSVKEELYVYSYEKREEYRYHYNLFTEYLDRYGNHLAISHFTTGRVVSLTMDEKTRELSKIQMSDQVWEFTDITKYTMDSEIGMLSIGKERYSIRNTVYFSDDKKITQEDLTDKDELMIIGKGKEVLSIVITTGHGVLSVKNSSDEVDFSGGYLQVGTKLFTKISGDMEIDIQEGTYLVSAVSPKGYGDVKEITIQRGSTTELDLAEFEGDGPRTGLITFAVDEPTAIVKVDNVEIDMEQGVELTYGVHSFVVVSDTYEPYARYLFVNSDKAKISIALSKVGVLKEQTATETEIKETDTSTETSTEGSTETQSESTGTTTPKPTTPTTPKPSTPSTSELMNPGSSQNANSGTSTGDREVDYYNGILSTLNTILGQ